MRKVLLVCFYLLITGASFAQNTIVRSHLDTVYVVDGAVANNLKNIKPDSVLNIAVLKPEENSVVYDPPKLVYLVETKNGATKVYQKKLSEFSKQYKEFIERDKKKDGTWRVEVTYNVNGKLFAGGRKETITELYNLNKENLSSIFIDSKFDYSYSPTMFYNIYITTKN